MVQKVFPTPYSGHVFRQIKISRPIFEKGHPRNIPVKLFQNWIRGFRQEDFLRISSCPSSAKSLFPRRPCFSTHQNFRNNFLKGSSKEQSCKIFPNSIFTNFFMSIKCKKSSPPGHFFFDGSKFCQQLLKRVTQSVSEEKNFQEFL